jgi:hypothetical protein
MIRVQRLLVRVAVVLAFAAAVAIGYRTAGAEEFCPGEDYCYTAGGCEACKNMYCGPLSANMSETPST